VIDSCLAGETPSGDARMADLDEKALGSVEKVFLRVLARGALAGYVQSHRPFTIFQPSRVRARCR
jgi:hypothetical protein